MHPTATTIKRRARKDRNEKRNSATRFELVVDQPVVRLYPSSTSTATLTGSIKLPHPNSSLADDSEVVVVSLVGVFIEGKRRMEIHRQETGSVVDSRVDRYGFQLTIPSTIPVSQRVDSGNGIEYIVSTTWNGTTYSTPVKIIADNSGSLTESTGRFSTTLQSEILGPIAYKFSAVEDDSFIVGSLVKTSLIFLSPPPFVSILSLTTQLLESIVLLPSSSSPGSNGSTITKQHVLFRIDGTLSAAFSRQPWHPSNLTPGAPIPSPLQELFQRKSLRRLEGGERSSFERVSRLPNCLTMRATTLTTGETEGPIGVRHFLRTEIVFRDGEGRRGKFIISSDPFLVASCLNTEESIPPPYAAENPSPHPSKSPLSCVCTRSIEELVRSARGVEGGVVESGGALVRKLSRESI